MTEQIKVNLIGYSDGRIEILQDGKFVGVASSMKKVIKAMLSDDVDEPRKAAKIVDDAQTIQDAIIKVLGDEGAFRPREIKSKVERFLKGQRKTYFTTTLGRMVKEELVIREKGLYFAAA